MERIALRPKSVKADIPLSPSAELAVVVVCFVGVVAVFVAWVSLAAQTARLLGLL